MKMLRFKLIARFEGFRRGAGFWYRKSTECNGLNHVFFVLGERNAIPNNPIDSRVPSASASNALRETIETLENSRGIRETFKQLWRFVSRSSEDLAYLIRPMPRRGKSFHRVPRNSSERCTRDTDQWNRLKESRDLKERASCTHGIESRATDDVTAPRVTKNNRF